MTSSDTPVPRRERNDARILEAARAVFVADPGAPIADVARHAGVGMSALYRRFESKEVLLRRLCADGLDAYIDAAERAIASEEDAWASFSGFVEAIVDADVHSLTVALAGTFTPTPEMFAASERAQRLTTELVVRARAAKALRADFEVTDLPFVLEQMSAVRVPEDPDRTKELRRRYLALQLDALHTGDSKPLPGSPPSDEELGRRWIPRSSAAAQR
jgi:AcrR family transcriptional regulator